MKITERFLSDNYWWSVLTYLQNTGNPYNVGVHQMCISYKPPKKFSKKTMKEQSDYAGRWKFFTFDTWEGIPVEPPTGSQLLELEVEDVVNLRVKNQAETYSRTDRYMVSVIEVLADALKKGGLLDNEWTEAEHFNKYVRKVLRAEEHVEAVRKEWEAAMDKQLEAELENAHSSSPSPSASETTPSLPSPEQSATPTSSGSDTITAETVATEADSSASSTASQADSSAQTEQSSEELPPLVEDGPAIEHATPANQEAEASTISTNPTATLAGSVDGTTNTSTTPSSKKSSRKVRVKIAK